MTDFSQLMGDKIDISEFNFVKIFEAFSVGQVAPAGLGNFEKLVIFVTHA